jgi:hypothetical protein
MGRMLPEAITALAIATGCNTDPCEERVARRERVEHKRRVIRPFRDWLYKVRVCESGNRNVNTGNGFYGYYQFTVGTWHATGGSGMPHWHGLLEQSFRAVIWRKRIGNPHQSSGWPVCG